MGRWTNPRSEGQGRPSLRLVADSSPASIRIDVLFVVILFAGVLAGLITAGFHAAASRSIFDAIGLNTTDAGAQGAGPLFSRSMVFLSFFVAWVVVGVGHAVVLGGSYGLLRIAGRIGPHRLIPLGLAVAAYASVVLIPSLAYSLDGGVNDLSAISVPRELFIACLVLAIIEVAMAGFVIFRVRLSRFGRVGVIGLVGTLVLLGMYLILIPSPDPVATAPTTLVTALRARSLEGLTIFWAALGLTFAGFAPRINRARE